MRSAEQFDAAKRLIAAGINDCAIARQLGIPRPTVRDWRCRPQRRPRLDGNTPCGVVHNFAALLAAPYCYLLGLYLGDGCISRDRRVWKLRIVLDKKYPAIIGRCGDAIDLLMSGQRAAVRSLPKGCVEVSLYSKHWPCLFPQHGPGRKHKRAIRLEPWQQALVDQATEEFILGLFTAALDALDITVDSVVQVHRLHLPQSGHRPPRQIRRAQGPRGTVE